MTSDTVERFALFVKTFLMSAHKKCFYPDPGPAEEICVGTVSSQGQGETNTDFSGVASM